MSPLHGHAEEGNKIFSLIERRGCRYCLYGRHGVECFWTGCVGFVLGECLFLLCLTWCSATGTIFIKGLGEQAMSTGFRTQPLSSGNLCRLLRRAVGDRVASAIHTRASHPMRDSVFPERPWLLFHSPFPLSGTSDANSQRGLVIVRFLLHSSCLH